MALDDILLEAEEKMTKTEEIVQHEFSGIRTGKASPVLVENIMVEVYGAHMRLRELAGITTPEPRVLVIQPWDASTIHAVEKAILKSSLGVTPAVQGKVIRLVMPELSQERRQEMVKKFRDIRSSTLIGSGPSLHNYSHGQGVLASVVVGGSE